MPETLLTSQQPQKAQPVGCVRLTEPPGRSVTALPSALQKGSFVAVLRSLREAPRS